MSKLWLPGFDTDFVWEHDLVQPGPAGALIDGMLRPVFFDRSAFNHFIGKLSCKEDGIGIELLNRREPEADYNHLPENEPEQPQARLAWRALRAVYPERRISKSKSTATVTRRVNHWIENQPENIADRNSVSDSTVARVLGRKGR
jgi:hypothetical protein